MNVVDSSAWLSYLAGDSNADKFAAAIENVKELIVPSISMTEVFKRVLQQRGEEFAIEVIAHMKEGKVIDLDSVLAIDAAAYGFELKLPLADSIIFATAKKYNATLWTQDGDFKDLEGVKYFPKR